MFTPGTPVTSTCTDLLSPLTTKRELPAASAADPAAKRGPKALPLPKPASAALPAPERALVVDPDGLLLAETFCIWGASWESSVKYGSYDSGKSPHGSACSDASELPLESSRRSSHMLPGVCHWLMADDRVISRTFSCDSLTKYGWYEAGYGVSLIFSFILLLKSRVTADTPGASGLAGGAVCRMGCWLL